MWEMDWLEKTRHSCCVVVKSGLWNKLLGFKFWLYHLMLHDFGTFLIFLNLDFLMLNGNSNTMNLMSL